MSDESDPLRHWRALEHTDREDTKPFDRGRFKGTSVKPIANIKLMTEHFGPCGIGWGMDKPEFTLVPAGNELLVYCAVGIWYDDGVEGEMSHRVYGVGGDKVLRVEKSGPFISDEAYKSAYTDALGNAMKHIGIMADIHSGEFDKYGKTQANTASPARAATAGAKPRWLALSEPLIDPIKNAESPRHLDSILRVHYDDLKAIESENPKAYDRLMTIAKERMAELVAALNEDVGAAPQLLGEP